VAIPVIQARNPLRSYQFRVAVISHGASTATKYVAGVKTVSGLRVTIGAFETWEGGNNLHRYANPNKVTWEPVTLEQGLALDNTFERWADAVLAYARNGEVVANEPVKREVLIDIWDENLYPSGPPTLAPPPSPSPNARFPLSNTAASRLLDRETELGPRVRRYRLKNAWINKYQPVTKLDSMTSEVVLLSVELAHEGWVKEDITQ
jgi:phage tail-like protein